MPYETREEILINTLAVRKSEEIRFSYVQYMGRIGIFEV